MQVSHHLAVALNGALQVGRAASKKVHFVCTSVVMSSYADHTMSRTAPS